MILWVMWSRIYTTIMIIIRSYMSLSLTLLSLFQLISPPAVIAANTASLLPSLAAFHNSQFKSLLLTVDISDKNKLKKMYTYSTVTWSKSVLSLRKLTTKRLLYSTRFPPTGITFLFFNKISLYPLNTHVNFYNKCVSIFALNKQINKVNVYYHDLELYDDIDNSDFDNSDDVDINRNTTYH